MSKFKNNPNILIKGVNGEEIWHSRSAVCNVIVLDSANNILVCLRGNAEDSPFKWCLPCGYLDWDEDIFECASREIWEECGIDIDKTGIRIYDLNTDPKRDAKQNISFRMCVKIFCEKPEVSNKNCEPNEIDKVEWISLEEVINKDFAFKHDDRIYEFFDKYYLKFF